MARPTLVRILLRPIVYRGDRPALVDEMLDGISIYWFTDTAGSAARLYWTVSVLLETRENGI